MFTRPALAICFAATLRLQGQDSPQGCEKYRNVPIPDADRPTTAQAMDVAKCTSSDLYYGGHGPPDPARARQCAYLEMDGGGNPDQPISLGRDILIMIYANGQGVSRNFDLALRFACGSRDAGGLASIPTLEKLKAQNWRGSDFDLCSEPGTLDAIDCRMLAGRMKQAVSRNKLNAILSKWSAPDKSAFATLQPTIEAFFKSRSEVETDMLSANYNRFAQEVYAELVEGLASALARLDEGEMPHFTHEEAVKADVELNQVYAQAIKRRRESRSVWRNYEEELRKTERLWLAYLVAWLQFARQKYPGVTEDSWRGWLIQERIAQMRLKM
jgi:hypothetical protein